MTTHTNRNPRPANTDVAVSNHGSICLVRPLTGAGHAWLSENVSDDSQWLGQALAVEPRYIDDLVEGMQNDGLVVT